MSNPIKVTRQKKKSRSIRRRASSRTSATLRPESKITPNVKAWLETLESEVGDGYKLPFTNEVIVERAAESSKASMHTPKQAKLEKRDGLTAARILRKKYRAMGKRERSHTPRKRISKAFRPRGKKGKVAKPSPALIASWVEKINDESDATWEDDLLNPADLRQWVREHCNDENIKGKKVLLNQAAAKAAMVLVRNGIRLRVKSIGEAKKAAIAAVRKVRIANKIKMPANEFLTAVLEAIGEMNL